MLSSVEYCPQPVWIISRTVYCPFPFYITVPSSPPHLLNTVVTDNMQFHNSDSTYQYVACCKFSHETEFAVHSRANTVNIRCYRINSCSNNRRKYTCNLLHHWIQTSSHRKFAYNSLGFPVLNFLKSNYVLQVGPIQRRNLCQHRFPDVGTPGVPQDVQGCW